MELVDFLSICSASRKGWVIGFFEIYSKEAVFIGRLLCQRLRLFLLKDLRKV